MENRVERIVLQTDRHRIVGDLTLPREGYRSRLSDYLNSGDLDFIPIVNAELTPLKESVGTLAELRDEGKIGHVGLSNVDTEQLGRAREIVPISSVQNRYSLGDRRSEPVLDACERDGIAFIPWFPLGAGGIEAEGVISRIADIHDATPFQVALAWL